MVEFSLQKGLAETASHPPSISAKGRKGHRVILWLVLFALICGGVVASLFIVSKRARKVAMSVAPVASLVRAVQVVRPALIAGNNAGCLQRLRRLPVVFSKARDRRSGVCRVDHAVWVKRVANARLHKPVLLNCATAEALTLWVRDSVAPVARRELGSPLRTVHHFGTYNCRRVRGSSFWLSEHAFANAIDISAFSVADGRRISVAGHWHRKDGRGRFLRAVAASACDPFRLVLTPRSNAAHRDHFHLDLGLWSNCGAATS